MKSAREKVQEREICTYQDVKNLNKKKKLATYQNQDYFEETKFNLYLLYIPYYVAYMCIHN